VLSPPAHADSCDGGLRFLGLTNDQARSVWLSATRSGDYELRAKSGTEDSWTMSRGGLHLSISGEVSPGNGGTHRLYNSNINCLIGTSNQVGGIIFPDLRPPEVTPMPPIIGWPTPPIERPVAPMPPIEGVPTPPIERPVVPMPPVEGVPTPPIERPVAPMPPIECTPEHPIEKGDGDDTRVVAERGQVSGQPPLCPGDARTLESLRTDPRYTHCFVAEVPLTPGREVDARTEWNVWADARYNLSSDERFGRDVDTDTGTVAFGVDRRLDVDFVAGLMMTAEDSQTEGFGGALEFDTTGLSIGPYIGYRINPEWALDASLSYGGYDNSSRILVLRGDYDSTRLSSMVNLNGLFVTEESVRVRPKVSISYTRTRNEAHPMHLGNTGLSLNVAKVTSSSGVASFSSEFSKAHFDERGRLTQPSLEIGVDYEFDRPGDGKVLSRNLAFEKTSPWSGSVRLGLLSELSGSTFLKFDLGYLSIGQGHLNEWELGLFLSHQFE
jgi:hypothetical protein